MLNGWIPSGQEVKMLSIAWLGRRVERRKEWREKEKQVGI